MSEKFGNCRRLEGKVIAVVGAGGIGDGLVERYAAEGASLVVGDLNIAMADKALNEAGAKGLSLQVDGADPDSVQAFFDRAVKEYGGLDGAHVNFALLNDAGVTPDVLDLPLDVFDANMHVNVRGYFVTTKYLVPHLKRRGGGSIVYTSSGAAVIASPMRTSYAMAKSATHALMRHVAKAFGGDGIRANCITPGYTAHEKLDGEELPGVRERVMERNLYKTRFGRPSDIAAMGALLLSDEGATVSGQVIAVDSGGTFRP